MAREWSDSQREAVEGARGTNLLLSAAAGSGKTSVLAGRIAALVKEGADISNMLVVTFTNAAVADMRERIVSELAGLAKNGGDAEKERLYRQSAAAERADISTIHAFCLGVLRRHFQAVGLDPSFRTASEAEAGVIAAEALDAVFTEKYAAPDDGFRLLLEAYGRKDDATLQNCVLALHRQLSALPDREAYKTLSLAKYDAGAAGGLPMVCRMLEDIGECLGMCQSSLLEAASICGDGFPATRAHLLLEAEAAGGLIEASKVSPEAFAAAAKAHSLPRLPQERQEPQERRARALALREAAKKRIREILDEPWLRDVPASYADLPLCRAQAAALFDLAEAFDAVFSEMKRAKNVIDYADMERMAYRALLDPAIAAEYRARYDHVFIDEYQDTSFLQEAVLSCVCREDNFFAVGDVKQSIYRFRQAQPDLFMRRYGEYGRGRGGRRIDLNRNYRSGRAVVETVNAVFGPIMTREAGGVDYGENERLTGWRDVDGACELLVVCNADPADPADPVAKVSNAEREARAAANRLIALKAGGSYRWRDMVVLMRSAQTNAQVFAKVFAEAGIPCYAQASEAHIETVEVELFLNLLRLIDNPLQDLPLLSVLLGPVCDLRLEQLLDVRKSFPGLPFHEAARRYASEEGDYTARDLAGFFDRLEEWTFNACVHTVDELIEDLLDRTGILDAVTALPGGNVRRKNLEMLLSHAQDFAATGEGLSGFLGFLDHVRASGGRGDSAHALGENDDVVRIMTVHRSKGLEFPVVVLSGMGNRFNVRDKAQDVVFHDRLGLGVRTFDPVLKTRRANPVRAAIAHAQAREALSEEMRILYVGMTRAKDVLIMTGTATGLENRLTALANPGDAAVFGAVCPLDFVCCALQRWGALGDFALRPGETLSVTVGRTSLTVRAVQPAPASPADEAAPAGWRQALTEPVRPDVLERVRASMEFYRLDPPARVPAKLPVSRLHPVAPKAPAARPVRGAAPTRAAEEGTAMHIVMQHVNLRAVRGEESVLHQIEGMVALGLLSEEQAGMVDAGAVAAFASGELGTRMKRAATLRREWPFTLRIGAKEAIDGAPPGVTVLVQGVMDACFEEDGAWVLVDFKTDRVAGEPLELAAKRHAGQLGFYAHALKTLTDMPVKEQWVYLFRANRGVRIG